MLYLARAKKFEVAYLCLQYFLPPLHNKIRQYLIKVAGQQLGAFEVLDVGGRKSHCTIGVPGWVTITDIPRETEIQKQLNLGITEEMVDLIPKLRSNVRSVIFDDMTRSKLPDNSFDCVIAVEVLEHVEEDVNFIRHSHRVLKPRGWFLMSTPNGDFVRNNNPDHKRHYTRQQLHSLLSSYFPHIEIEYAIKGGKYRRLGLAPWSLKRPLQTGLSMIGNFVNSWQSSQPSLKSQSQGTHHLIALARK
jgi:SAM-dependent methyltransferase